MKKIITLFLSGIFGWGACSDDSDFVNAPLNDIVKTYCAETGLERPADAYNYPIVPGTPAWEKLQTGDQMWEACQIPGKVVRKLSTEALVQAVIEFPLLPEIAHRAQYRTDFDPFGKTALYKELSERKDASSILMDRELILLRSDRSYFSVESFSIVCAQPNFASNYTDEEIRTLIGVWKKKGYVTGGVSYLVARLLDTKGLFDAYPEVRTYILRGDWSTGLHHDLIRDKAQSMLP